jgi:hypothetical protein
LPGGNKLFKKILTIFTIFIFFFLLIPDKSFAGDWIRQIGDPKDSPISSDIKTIFIKDDNDSVYFKFESYKDWNLKETELLMIIINTENSNISDSRYGLGIARIGGDYIGILVDLENKDNTYECNVNFQYNSSFGEVTIQKSYTDNKLKEFSFAVAVTSTDYDELIVDLCPDNGTLQKYQKGQSNDKPKLAVNPSSLSLGSTVFGNDLKGEFDVANEGGGNLEVKITPNSNYLIVSPDQVNIESYSSNKIQLRVDTSNLSPKSYSELINITSNGGNFTINVNFEILKEPELYLEKDIIDLGKVIIGERKSENVTIGNKNKGPIKVKILSNSDWLIVSMNNFSSESESIKVTAITKKLDEGEYNGVLRISSDGGKGEINVTMAVIRPLSIDKKLIDFGKLNSDNLKVDQQKITLTNNTDDTLSVKVKSDSDWIKMDKYNLSIPSEENEELNVDIDFSNFTDESKVYSGKITLEYGDQISEIAVNIEIVQIPPKMTINTEEDTSEIAEIKTSVKIGDIFEKKIKITNTGSGVLKVKVSINDENSPIKLNKRNIILKQNDSADLILTIDYKDVKPGDYSSVLTLDSNVEKREIPVNITFINPEILIKLYIGSPVAFVGEKNVMLDSPPFIEKGTTMVPLRFIGEGFGAEVKWENIGKGRVVINIKNKNIILDIGSNTAYINDVPKQLLAPPVIKNGRTFVPVRFISEGLGAEVGWDSVKQEIAIKYNPI